MFNQTKQFAMLCRTMGLLLILLSTLPGRVFAAETDKAFFASTRLATSITPGLKTAPADIQTETDALRFGSSVSPTLTASLTLRAGYRLPQQFTLSAAWSAARDWVPCDTCRDGFAPEMGGRSTTDWIRTSDLGLTLIHRGVQLLSNDRLRLSPQLGVTIPVSRNSLSCNPMYGAIQVGAGFSGTIQGIRWTAQHHTSRAFYQFAHAPVGRCAPPLRDETGTKTLTGDVRPTPWDGERFVGGMGNPAWTQSAQIQLTNLQAPLTKTLQGKAGEWMHNHLYTSLRIGAVGRQSRADDNTEIQVASGSLEQSNAHNPWVWMWTMSVSAGAKLHDKHRMDLQFSNQVPRLLTDPGATFSTIPSRTAISLSWTTNH